jgi:hypothetical protein
VAAGTDPWHLLEDGLRHSGTGQIVQIAALSRGH